MFPWREFKMYYFFGFSSCTCFPGKCGYPEFCRLGSIHWLIVTLLHHALNTNHCCIRVILRHSHCSLIGHIMVFSLCSFFLLFVLVHPNFTVFFYLRMEDSEFPLALVLNHTPSSTDLMSAFFPCEVFRSAPLECCLTWWSTHGVCLHEIAYCILCCCL